MNDDQKKNIALAVKNGGPGNAEWLARLLYHVHGEKFKGASSLFDHNCSRHEMLCEISGAFAERDAGALFTDLTLAYKGRCKIPNLPVYDGRNIFDLAQEKEKSSLASAIEKSGGLKFPIALRTDAARSFIFQWRQKTAPAELRDHFRMVSKERVDFNMGPENFNDVVMSMAGRLMMLKDTKPADVLLNRMHWNHLDDHNAINLSGLREIAVQQEAFEIAAYIRDVLKNRTATIAAASAAAPPGLMLPAPASGDQPRYEF